MLVVASVLSLALVAGLSAQAKKEPKSGLDRIEGTIQSIDREKGTIAVRQRDRASIVWTIIYSTNTAFTYRNEESNVDEMKVGRRVIVLGQFREKNSNRLTALRIDVRTGK
jgi:hypothetical protein